MSGFTEQLAAVPLPVVLFALTLLTVGRATLLRSFHPAARVGASITESVMLALVLVFFLFQPFAGQSYYIPSASMRPTLWENDRLFINKWVYRTSISRCRRRLWFFAFLHTSRFG